MEKAFLTGSKAIMDGMSNVNCPVDAKTASIERIALNCIKYMYFKLRFLRVYLNMRLMYIMMILVNRDFLPHQSLLI